MSPTLVVQIVFWSSSTTRSCYEAEHKAMIDACENMICSVSERFPKNCHFEWESSLSLYCHCGVIYTSISLWVIRTPWNMYGCVHGERIHNEIVELAAYLFYGSLKSAKGIERGACLASGLLQISITSQHSFVHVLSCRDRTQIESRSNYLACFTNAGLDY